MLGKYSNIAMLFEGTNAMQKVDEILQAAEKRQDICLMAVANSKRAAVMLGEIRYCDTHLDVLDVESQSHK